MIDGCEDARRVGRDEMNLCEFPITLLAERVPPGRKTMVFEGRHGKLTITGSDAYGLPTAPDSDVIVGLIQLTKLRNNFTDPTVTFSRYELLRLLNWDDQGRHYRRLDESLNRWVGVTLYYDGCWWDNQVKCRVDAKFHIIDSVMLYDQEVRHRLRARQQPPPLSSFTWGKIFFRSCQADNLKQLDLDTYFSLKSAVSKQLYRFLDKRFYHRREWTFDLRELAVEHVGLSRTYAVGGIKRKLNHALDELEEIGLLEEMSAVDRYSKSGRGEWKIRLVRKLPAPAEMKPEPEPGPEPTGLERELIDRGVTQAVAADLVRDYPEDHIKAQIGNLAAKRRKVKDPGAWLASAIRKNFAVPAEPKARAEPTAVPAVDRADRERARKAAQEFLSLPVEEQERINAAALEDADPADRAAYEAETDERVRRMMMVPLRDAYLAKLATVG